MTTAELLKTPLHDWHQTHGGRMVDFAGWSMPVQYSTIVEEHQAVRNRVGLFDISHMGRLRFDGPDARDWLQFVTTNNVEKLKPGRIQYSLICRDDGGVIDDVLVYRLTETDGYGMVCNASNRLKVLEQLEARKGPRNATLADSTFDTAMIAIQGPLALNTLQSLFDGPTLSERRYYSHVSGNLQGTNVSVSRTGYTGEDGFEVVVPRDVAEATWTALLDEGRDRGILPCGLGARDTLRFEAGMPLHGHEIAESINPYAAGLGMFLKLEKGDFVGRAALERLKDDPGAERVGLELQGKRIAREGATVQKNGERIGVVTSGTFSPTLERPLAMALVNPGAAPLDAEIQVDVRGRLEPARVVGLPFYRRDR